MLATARPMRARTLRSDGKDYRADYEHDDLSPNNLKPPNAPRANGPLCETYERERNPNGSCQWHSEILQSFARLRLYLAGGRRQRRVRPCLRARALRRSGAERGRQGLLRDRGRQARARQASRERAARLNLSPPRLILNRQAKPAGFLCADGMPRAIAAGGARSGVTPHRLWRHRRLEENREKRGNEQRHADADDASLPAEPVEELAEDRGAHEPAEEIEGKIETARRAPVRACRPADKAGGSGLREEGADAEKDHAGQERGKA